MKRALLILLLLGAMGFAVEPPVELTVDDAIKLAVENNPAYRISEQEVKQYRYRLMENFGFLPRAVPVGEQNPERETDDHRNPRRFYRRRTDGGDPSLHQDYEFTFQLVQPVFTGGKIFYNYKNAELDLRIAREKERN